MLNERFVEAEKICRDLLDPTRKELEHGLELHSGSVVVDAYGFSPRSAVYGDRLAAAAKEGAGPSELKDMREESSMTRCVYDLREREEYLEAWEKSGVTCVMQNAGEEEQTAAGAVKRLGHFTLVTDILGGRVSKAVCAGDIEKAREEGRRCLCMTSNTTPLAGEFRTVEEELGYIGIFYNLGIRMMHLTYNRRNLIGDGCAETANAGLSDFGREAVKRMNSAGVIPDVAHSGQMTSLEAARVSGSPVVASHSGAAAVNSHVRCKTDEVLSAIADSGGYTGVFCVSRFLGRGGDVNAMLDHLDYIAGKFGTDHVAIGTDIGYVSSRNDGESRKVPASPRTRTHWRSLWPPDEEERRRAWEEKEQTRSLAWTNWPLFTVGLVKRGYSDDDIRKIIGGNVLRVLRATDEGKKYRRKRCV